MTAPPPPFLLALLALWTIWGASWVAAWRWTGATQHGAGAGAQRRYRAINLLGWAMLFVDGIGRPGRHGMWPPPVWRVAPPLGWALVAVALAGLVFAWSARLTLGRLWSADVTRKADHRIVDHGPYAIVRHPIYTGLLLGALALAVAKGTPVALAGCGLMLVGYHLKARLEERFLSAELGATAYAAYVRRVPMLVPFGRH